MSYRLHLGAISSNQALRALLISNSLVLISLGMLVPVYALFVTQVGGGALSAGLTAGALGLTSAVSALISGKWIDNRPPSHTRNIMAFGWAAIGLVLLFYLFVDTLPMLFLAQILFGFVKTISAPAFDTLYARHLDRKSTGQEYGMWEASFFLTAAIGAVLGGVIVNWFGFNGVFIVMAALAFIAAAYIARLPRHIF